MKPLFYFLLLLICAVQMQAQDKTRSIDSLLRTYYNEDEPGAFVHVLSNNNIVFKKGYGLSNLQTKEKITATTNFNIGSVTKQFTAFCIVTLVEKKLLSLDDKIGKYFPGMNPAIGNLITIQQLLTHSSGILDHYGFTDTHALKHATDIDVLHAIKNTDSTYFMPGTHYRYSNTAFCLLALIIEKVSGLSYADYIQKNIFTPLGMKHSIVLKIGQLIYNQAYGYELDEKTKHFNKLDADEAIFFSTEGDGGIYTSADDYVRWLAFLQKPSSQAAASIKKCRSPQFVVDSLQKLFYGYGWFVSMKGNTRAIYHTGSNGGFRAIVFTMPAKNYTVTIFSNRTGVDLEKLLQQINEILGVTNNSFTKTEALVSFINSSPIFAPCKEII